MKKKISVRLLIKCSSLTKRLSEATEKSVLNKERTWVTSGSLGKSPDRKCDVGILDNL